MPTNSEVMALCVSDIHVTHVPPVCRRDEGNWYEAMSDKWEQLHIVWTECGCPPILIAGDVFDRWNAPYEVTHWLTQLLKQLFKGDVYAIPGQHDLPEHSLADMHRSAYGMLVASGAVKDLSGYHGVRSVVLPVAGRTLGLCGFAWGQPEAAVDIEADITVAMVHRYAYAKREQAYAQAGEDGDVDQHQYSGFTFVHYGDNHIRWQSKKRFNPGSFYRRFTPDANLLTGGYAIKANRTAEPFYFDDTEDVFVSQAGTDAEAATQPTSDVSWVLNRLERLTQNTHDVRAIVTELLAMSTVSPQIKSKVMSTLT